MKPWIAFVSHNMSHKFWFSPALSKSVNSRVEDKSLGSQFSLIPAGEPGRPILLQVPKFAVSFLLELRLLLDGDDVDGWVRGHCLRHRHGSRLPGSLPPRRLGEYLSQTDKNYFKEGRSVYDHCSLKGGIQFTIKNVSVCKELFL